MGDRMKRLLLTCFGLGWLPMAPGTWGSLPVAIIFAVLCGVGGSVLLITVVMAIFVLIGSVICVKFAPVAIAAVGKDDPGEVVADEFAGQAVAFLGLRFLLVDMSSACEIWAIAAAGFVLFRIFDITKPWPIRKLEKLSAGWGILCDDLCAGFFAAICLHIFSAVWFSYQCC